MRLTDLLALSHVPRWSTVPHRVTQSVADHTYRAMVIYTELCARLALQPDPASIRYLLSHDGAESRSGDIPGIFKRKITEAVSIAERAVCPWLALEPLPGDAFHAQLTKLADVIETHTFINRNGCGLHASRVSDMTVSAVQDHADRIRNMADARARNLWSVIESIIRDINTEAEREPE